MLGNYLRQQMNLAHSNDVIDTISSHELTIPAQPPENITLDEFKEHVKKYMEIDNWLKKAQDVIKEKKRQKNTLSEVITRFMIRYDIDDLNSKFGKISCKVKQVKQQVSQKDIKLKINEHFKDNQQECKQLMHTLFEDRPTVEKTSLRRIKIT